MGLFVVAMATMENSFGAVIAAIDASQAASW